MKKFLSIFLVVALLVSMVSVCVLAADTNVALGKSYTVSGCGEGYKNLEGQWPSDYTANLTDGVAEEELTFGLTRNWFGFYENGDSTFNSAVDKVGTIVIDLGSEVSGINKFRAHLGNHYENGVASPESLTVSVSVDGKTYTEAGSFEIKSTSEEENKIISYWTEVKGVNVKARYVKFEMKISGVFGFLNELEVYASGSSGKPATPSKITYNLIDEKLDWVTNDATYADQTGKCTFSFDGGKLVASSDVLWPNVSATYADGGIVISPDDEIAVDLELVSGSLNLALILEVNGAEHFVYVQHNIAPDNVDASSGDLNVAGKYNGSFKIKDAIGNSVDSAPVAGCSTIIAADSYTLKSIRVCPCGGSAFVTINSLTVTTDAPVIDNPGTGEEIMVFALIALVALGGAVVVSKKAR